MTASRRGRSHGPDPDFGCNWSGTFGRAVSNGPVRLGNDVNGVEIAARTVDNMVRTPTRVLVADARDVQALREAGLDRCDVILVVVGKPMEASILALVYARMLRVQFWAKAESWMHLRIPLKPGADRLGRSGGPAGRADVAQPAGAGVRERRQRLSGHGHPS